MKICLYDTTLRDGNQTTGISFSLQDKLLIAKQLDRLGVHMIEGGWPNPTNKTDVEFFKEVRKLKLKAKITAFGMTRRPNAKCESDVILKSLADAKPDAVCVVGKTWNLHVTEVLRTTLEENLNMIRESVAYLKKHTGEVVYDAEHFFDGYKADAKYAFETLRAAVQGGAEHLVLCDTNGGTLPMQYAEIVKKVLAEFKDIHIGVHNHNDSGCAVANTLLAVSLGVTHVQGTINGLGERCGNADLITVIADLQLKMGIKAVSDAQLRLLKEVSATVSELANLTANRHAPFVGDSAFSHKGGMHIDSALKVSRSYEHIDPSLVGNDTHYVLSDQSGSSMVVQKLKRIMPKLEKSDPGVKKILQRVKDLEHEGWTFEAADASFALLALGEMGRIKKEPFVVKSFRVIEEKHGDGTLLSEATIKVEVDSEIYHTAAEGDGPVNAMDKALRKAMAKFFPELKKIELVDYKVRVLTREGGTGAKVHVHIVSTDGKETWGTVGVSTNIVEASLIALVDSFRWRLLK